MLFTTGLTTRLTKLILVAAALLYCSAFAQAGFLVFDPDAGGNSVKLSVNTFQYGAGNSLARGAVPFIAGNSFQLLFQGQLNSVVTDTAAQLTPAGLNAAGTIGGVAPYEITIVLSATETVSNALGNFARFELSPAQALDPFIEIYYDPNQNANALAGTGYNDGMLILRAVPNPNIPNTGMFSQANPQPSAAINLDNFGTNDFVTAGPGGTNVTSVLGVAATKLSAVVTYVNSSFFVTPVQGDVGRQVAIGDIISFDLGQAAPFDTIQPSRLFVGTANTGTSSGPAASVNPALGASNGTSGPDVQFQTIAAATIFAGSATPTSTPMVTSVPSVSTTPTPTPSATPTPASSPVVSVTSDKGQIREGHAAIITFAVTPATHGPITVNYSTLGTATLNTDYTVSGTPGQVVIGANQSSVSIGLQALVDAVKEGNGETARIVVAAGSGYTAAASPNNRAVVTILDPNSTPTPTPSPTATATPSPTTTPTPSATPTPASSPAVSVVATDSQVREGHNTVITFIVAAFGHEAITVNYSTLGTATLNTDYTLSGTPGQVVIPTNVSTASITLQANSDLTKEATGGESARIVVEAGAGYTVAVKPKNKATVTILDSNAPPTPTPSPTPTPGPAIFVSADRVQVREGHDAVITFTVAAFGHAAITVNYSTLGSATLNTDYTLTGSPGQVVIPLNQPSASITLHALTDTVKETNGENARIALGAGSGYTVAPSPNDKVGIAILDPP